MASYNIRDGRRGGMHSAVRALRNGRIDVAVVQETKIAEATFAPRQYRGYTIRVTPSSGRNCGGVGLIVRETEHFTVENVKVKGPNVISFQLVTGEEERWHIVGAYFPPSDKNGKARRLAMAALDDAPGGTKPLLIGDLNSDLDFPRDRQEEILAADLEERGMRCATRGYRPRRTRRVRGRWTWRHRRALPSGEATSVRSKPDYFLMRGVDRGRVRRCRWVRPRHHNSDHRALVVQLRARPGGVRQYTRERRKLPVAPPPQ